MNDLLARTLRRTVLAVVVAVAVLVFAHRIVPHWSTRYASYLIVFTIWMAWFVELVVGILEAWQPDEG